MIECTIIIRNNKITQPRILLSMEYKQNKLEPSQVGENYDIFIQKNLLYDVCFFTNVMPIPNKICKINASNQTLIE